MNKLRGFPSVYAISTVDAFDRRSNLIRSFREFGVDVNIRVFSRNTDSEKIQFELEPLTLPNTPVNICISHLKSIKRWYNETDEPYAFFCEDDLSLETVKYWSFTWEEFVNNLPKDWECVQLCWLRELFFHFGFKIRNRCWDDWSAAAYILKRDFAKKLIDNYYPNDTFNLDVKGLDAHIRPYWAKRQSPEGLIFSAIGKVYSFPLFVESQDFYSKDANEGVSHSQSYKTAMTWWANEACRKHLSEFNE
jgi:hypothetical protein